jgi:NADPH:quinone reductase-like Zn-dependent oxidoreductase
MHAIVIRRHGDPDVLEPAEVARPEPAAGEALVRVEAVSVNAFLDVSNRAGKVPFARYDFPHVLGSEHAGTVAGYGAGTTGPVPVGAPVVIRNTVFCGHCDMCTAGSSEACRTLGIIGVTRSGAYAEYTTVPVANLRPLPPGCRPIEAAAMAVNGPLGYAQLRAAGLEATRTVLIQGAGSSAGSMAAIVARTLGKVVLGTSRGADRAARLATLPMYTAVVDSTAPDARDQVHDLTGGLGVDVVLDNLGAPTLWQLGMDVLAPRGRIVTSGAKFGGIVEVDLRTLYTRSQRLVGLRSASEQDHDAFWKLVETAAVRPLVDSTFPLDAVADAHRHIESGANVGRVVLTVSATK